MSYQKIKQKTVKVRKDHGCIWCGEWITKGMEAIYRVYTFEDVFQTDYLHPECFEAMERSDDISDGFMEGEFFRGMSDVESNEEHYKISKEDMEQDMEESSRLPKEMKNKEAKRSWWNRVKDWWHEFLYYDRIW